MIILVRKTKKGGTDTTAPGSGAHGSRLTVHVDLEEGSAGGLTSTPVPKHVQMCPHNHVPSGHLLVHLNLPLYTALGGR